jgi:micrococcal nuclease
MVVGRALCIVILVSASACRRDPQFGSDAGFDGGPPRDAGDPEIGAPFEGELVLDDARVTAVDPALLPQALTPCREPVLVRVGSVVDGDTMSVTGVSETLDTRVRFIGVDAPEIAHDGDPADCYSSEAAEFSRMLRGHLVWLTFDESCLDPYDRLLAYVHIGPGVQDLWERQLLRRGLARVLIVGRNDALASQFEADVGIAERDGVGLWTACR